MRLQSTWLGAFFVVSFISHAVHAGPAEDRAAAEALFRAGRALVKQAKYAEACPKLEASQKLEPTAGTLLALGDCYELNGQTASAWTTYNDAKYMAIKADDKKRADEGQRRAGLLEPKLSRIQVEVAKEARIDGFEVRRNGNALDPAMFGVPVPIDPGKQTFEATAPGYEKWLDDQVVVEAKPGVTIVRVPALSKISVPITPPVEKDKSVVVVKPDPAAQPAGSSGISTLSTQRIVGIAVAGVGVAGVIVGSVFGGQTLSKVKEADAFCSADDPPKCTQPGFDLHQQANTTAMISNLGLGIGGAAIIGGIVLFAVAPSQKKTQTSSAFRLVPAVGPGLSGIWFGGEF